MSTILRVGQIITLTKDWTVGKSNKICFPIGSQHIISEIRPTKCSCKNNNDWDLVWLGNYYTTEDTKGGINCSQCKGEVVHETKMWLPDHYLSPVTKDEPDIDKLQAQLDLMRLLADGKISHKSYEKIIQMTDGDKEMLLLGMGIINNKKEEI
jgi:hypothetical protein